MKIIALSNYTFLVKELKKSLIHTEIIFINDSSELFNLDIYESNFLLLYHLDNDEKTLDNLKLFKDEFKNIKIIALRNNTNNIEGCSLLKKECKAYVHAISNISILEDVIKTVLNGKIWMYPELMQFLIHSIPLQDKEENKLLKEVTIKELEVLELVSQGNNNIEIAKVLSIAEVTVKKHISSLFKKLNQKDRLSLALYFKNHK